MAASRARLGFTIALLAAHAAGLLPAGAALASHCPIDRYYRASSDASANGARTMAVGDFDGDGSDDVAVGGATAGGIAVHLATAQTQPPFFHARVPYMAGADVLGLAAGDVDGNGTIDLVACTRTAVVHVLYGDGAGHFAPPVTHPAGVSAYHVAIADLNADGHQDLAVVLNECPGAISILLGAGNGAFLAPVSYPVGCYPAAVVVDDLDGDTVPDLAVTVYNDGVVKVLAGVGDGTFTSPQPFASAPAPFGIATGDFDGDGRRDLAIACLRGESRSLALLLNRGVAGTMTFAPLLSYPAYGGPCVATGDLDDDGLDDVVTGSFTGVFHVLRSTGNALQLVTSLQMSGALYAVAPLRVAGFGHVDFVAASLTGSQLSTVIHFGCDGPPGSVLTAWVPDGLILTPADVYPSGLLATTGVENTAILGWTSQDANGEDVVLQRVTRTGALLWGRHGIEVAWTPEREYLRGLTNDLAGGAIAAWTTLESAGLFVRRIGADGVPSPEWPSPLRLTTRPVIDAKLAPDGQGGAYVLALHHAGGVHEIRLHRVRADGSETAPWTGGVVLATAAPGESFSGLHAQPAADACLVGWVRTRLECTVGCSTVRGFELRRVGRFGSVDLARSHTSPLPTGMRLADDGAGGWVAVLSSNASIVTVELRGASPATADWSRVLTSSARSTAVGSRLDGGDLLLAWIGSSGDPAGIRVRGDGTPAAGWTAPRTLIDVPGTVSRLETAPAPNGGFFASWVETRGSETDLLGAVFAENGSVLPGSSPWGTLVCGIPDAPELATMVPIGPGTAVVGWTDIRNRVAGVQVAPLFSDVPVSALASLVAARVEDGRIVVEWLCEDDAGVRVERSRNDGPWERLGAPAREAEGRVTFRDADVGPGDRIGYRLCWPRASGDVTAAEAWVDVPSGGFRLVHVRPNPARGPVRIAFELERGLPATLEIFDARGRRVHARTVVASLGPIQSIEWPARTPGAYFVRLSQGSRRAGLRFVAIR